MPVPPHKSCSSIPLLGTARRNISTGAVPHRTAPGCHDPENVSFRITITRNQGELPAAFHCMSVVGRRVCPGAEAGRLGQQAARQRRALPVGRRRSAPSAHPPTEPCQSPADGALGGAMGRGHVVGW